MLHRRTVAHLLVFCWAIGPATLFAQGPSVIRTVAITGAPAPGTDGGVTYRSLSPPQLNDLGQVAFDARLQGTGVVDQNDGAVYSEGGGLGTQLFLREGDDAPALGAGVTVESIEGASTSLNDRGQVAVFATFSGPTPGADSTLGLLRGLQRDDIQLIAHQDDSIVGLAPEARHEVIFPSFLAFNDLGEAVYSASLSGPGIEGANFLAVIKADGTTGPSLVARQGDQFIGESVDDGIFPNPERVIGLNDHGDVVPDTLIQVELNLNITGQAIAVARTSGGIELITRTGVPIDTSLVDPESVFRQFGLADVNNQGDVVFQGRFRELQGPNQFQSGLFVYRGTEQILESVALVGDEIDIRGSDSTFLGFSGIHAQINHFGMTAFGASFVDPQNGNQIGTGLFSEGRGKGLELVVKTGDPIPGAAGAIFESLGIPILNARGQLLFAGEQNFAGPSNGIFVHDVDGEIKVIARPGDLIDVANDPSNPDYKTISSVAITQSSSIDPEIGSGNEDGRPSAFNELGQVAFWASFTDGSSGIFVSNLVAIVPEPTGCTLAMMAVAVLAVRYRGASRS